MDIKDLLRDLLNYCDNSKVTASSFTDIQNVNYENEYIVVKRIASSNKWEGIPHKSKMIKQWSIVVDIKKDFEGLDTFKLLSEIFDVRITTVKGGYFNGYKAIRFYNMTDNPNEKITYKLLDYIFNI